MAECHQSTGYLGGCKDWVPPVPRVPGGQTVRVLSPARPQATCGMKGLSLASRQGTWWPKGLNPASPQGTRRLKDWYPEDWYSDDLTGALTIFAVVPQVSGREII